MTHAPARSIVTVLAMLSACSGGASISDADRETTGSETEIATLDTLAVLAVSAEDATATDAIHRLREAGPDGHRALLDAHASAIEVLRTSPPLAPTPDDARLRHAIDVVSGQRDGHASGLFWFTDLEAAQDEARATGRPILALRLLGRLDEELSCANSRYFRVVLYPDARVRALLAEHFVLYWSSERPAPRVTIDMGDGRRIERTITGNSVHYVMDADGRVLDALPGLYTPETFVTGLESARLIVTACGAAVDFASCVAREHTTRLEAVRVAWGRMATGTSLPSWEGLDAARAVPADDAPSVASAVRTTMSKMFVEQPVLDLFVPSAGRPTPEVRVDWFALADRERPVSALDPRTLALLQLKTGARDVTQIAATLTRTAAADALANEMTMHRVIHAWLADPTSGATVWAALNVRVYAELFLTPASDPWLGLQSAGVWDAIETVRR